MRVGFDLTWRGLYYGSASTAQRMYRGTSLMRKLLTLGPCSRPTHRALGWS